MKTMRRWGKLFGLAGLGLLAWVPMARGHGEAPERLAAGGGPLAAPIPGLEEFMEGLNRHSRWQFDGRQLSLLGEINKHLHHAGEIRAARLSGYTAADADYQRALAQHKLLDLLEHHTADLVELDFTRGATGHDVMRPLRLPALQGVVFFKVTTGAGPSEFSVRTVNLTRSGDAGPFTLEVLESGTSYILVGFEEIPADLTRMVVTFTVRGGDQPAYWSGLSIEAGRTGQLSLTVEDANGEPCPALVRLVHAASGKLWAPANAVDIWPVMTSVRGIPATGSVQPYMHYFLNRSLRGHYWIVPGPFEMALPEGEWDLHVLRGIEYKPVTTRLKVDAGGWTTERVRLERWENMPARGWWSGDDHVHARMMSSQDARDIMAFVQAADINVANILEMGDAARTFYEQRGFGKAYRVQAGGHVLVPGQEDPRSDFGHAIGMNLTRLARDLDKYMLNDWVADEIHRQGGLYGHTHVGEGGLGVHRDMTLLMPRGKSDFASIMQNILGTGLYYDFLNLGFKLAASAGSDVPYGGAVGITRVYAHIGKDTPFSADAWFDAVKAGRTFVTNGPMLELEVDGELPGAELVLPASRPVRVKARAWGLAGMSAPARFSLVRNGVAVKELRPDGPGQDALELDLELDPGNGCWIAVSAQGMDGTQAHTTPVYVRREGFRHWNTDQAARLIDERMATLDEIEELVRAQVDRLAAGTLSELEFLNVLVARQAAEIIERTTLVRSLYWELRETLEKELNAVD